MGLKPARARVTTRVVRKWARRSPHAALIAGRVVSDSTSPPSPFLTLALALAHGDEQGGPQPQKQSQWINEAATRTTTKPRINPRASYVAVTIKSEKTLFCST